jgi:hypothetical protein
MKRTAWFERERGSELTHAVDDPSFVMPADVTPDWVRLPPELGGAELRVIEAHRAECPKCKAEAPVRHLVAEHGYGVADCATCGFTWYRLNGGHRAS